MVKWLGKAYTTWDGDPALQLVWLGALGHSVLSLTWRRNLFFGRSRCHHCSLLAFCSRWQIHVLFDAVGWLFKVGVIQQKKLYQRGYSTREFRVDRESRTRRIMFPLEVQQSQFLPPPTFAVRWVQINHRCLIGRLRGVWRVSTGIVTCHGE